MNLMMNPIRAAGHSRKNHRRAININPQINKRIRRLKGKPVSAFAK
jgi:hypothetical protein